MRDRLGNCRNLPMHVIIGSLDPMMYMKEWVRDDVAELKKLAYDVVFHEHPQLAHHVPDEEGPQVLAKLLKSPCNLCAKRLTRTFGGGMWYWIEAKLERSLGLMIDQLRDSLDPSRAFCASIEVR